MSNRVLPVFAVGFCNGILLYGNRQETAVYLTGLLFLFVFTISCAGRPRRRRLSGKEWGRRAAVLAASFALGTVGGAGCAAVEEYRWQMFCATECVAAPEYETFYTFSGRVKDVRCSGDSVRVVVSEVRSGQGEKLWDGTIYLSDTVNVPDLLPGDSVVFCEKEGKPVSLCAEATNPGQMDLRRQNRANGLGWVLFDEVEWKRTDGPVPVRYLPDRLLFRLRRALSQTADDLISDKSVRGMVKGMILGEKEYLEDDLKESFRANGISHILAISGLHLSIVGTGLYRLLRKKKVPPKAACAAAAFVTVCYVRMSGNSPASLRAMIMLLLFFLAEFAGRTYAPFQAMSLAAVLILAPHPTRLYEASFLYSFLSVFAAHFAARIMWRGKELKDREKLSLGKEQGRIRAGQRMVRFVNRQFPGLVIGGVNAGLSAYFSGEFPLHSALVNGLVLPFMMPIWLFSAAILVGGWILALPGKCGLYGLYRWILAHTAEPAATGLLKMMCDGPFGASGTSRQIGRALTAVTGRPHFRILLLYFALLAIGGSVLYLWEELWKRRFLYCKKEDNQRYRELVRGRCRCYWARLLAVFIPVGAALILNRPAPEEGFRAAFLDIGQGDCCVLSMPNGATVLIDGGSLNVNRPGQSRLEPYLTYIGCGRVIDAVFVSHPDADHVNALWEIWEDGYRFRRIYVGFDPEQVAQGGGKGGYWEDLYLAAKEETQFFLMERGDTVSIGETEFTALYPPDAMKSGGENENSLVLLVQNGENSVLFSGDIGAEQEAEIAKDWNYGSVDVLKVPHHGSRYSCSEELLRATDPGMAVISCGNNNYGHPAPTTLLRLDEMEIPTHITREQGAYVVDFKDK